MKKQLRENQKQEALMRMNALVEKFNLNPKLIKYLKEEKLYYSYLTAGGFMGSIDKISYDEKYETICRDFEVDKNAYVYHAIESESIDGKLFTLLYVSSNPDEWEYERLESNYISAYAYNFDMNDGEYGDVFLNSVHGALVRIDI